MELGLIGEHERNHVTPAHPELTSRPLRPQPMFLGLVKAALAHGVIGVDTNADQALSARARERLDR